MSRMKDGHIDFMNLKVEWLGFLRALFERERYQVAARDGLDGIQLQPDLALSRDEVKAIVELKLHRSDRVPLTLVRNAFINVASLMAYHHAARAF